MTRPGYNAVGGGLTGDDGFMGRDGNAVEPFKRTLLMGQNWNCLIILNLFILGL